MDLYVYRGLSSVPSIDFNCLRTLALLRLCNVPVRVHTNGNPFQSPNGQLPYLRTEDGRLVAGYTQIVQHLNEEGLGREVLRSKRAGLADGYVSLLHNQLFAAVQYFLWGEPQTTEHTRQMYAKRTPFPFSFYYPQAYVRTTDRLMLALENFSVDDKIVDHDTTAMLIAARKCLNSFEAKLSEGESGEKPTGGFVLGSPTELDSTLYAYLAIVQHMLPHNNALRTHLAECKNALAFAGHFAKMHIPKGDFIRPELIDRAEEQRLNGTATTQDSADRDAEQSKWMPKILAASIACLLMSLFAYKNGILQRSNDGGYVDMDYEDDDEDDE